jgi:electron transport complex protein RnfE
MRKLKILTKGLLKENPVLVLLLGFCPALAVSSQAENAIGMGIATTIVLLGSNIVVSLLRKTIPDKVRIPCYIVLIAGFVTIVSMLIEAYAFSMHQALGIFLPLITVNCIVFGRAEMFAKKNNPLDSAIDALGTGAGFTLALLAIASVREILGNGSWFGIEIIWLKDNNISIFALAPGGFIALAFIIALVNKLSKHQKSPFGKINKRGDIGCANCPMASTCTKKSKL